MTKKELKNIPALSDLSDAIRFPSLNFCGSVASDEDIQEVLDLRKKYREAAAKHPYSVYQLADGTWITKLDDPSKKSGIRKIHRSTENGVWDYLAEFYASEGKTTLAAIYPLWLEGKKTGKGDKDSNIKRLSAEWNAYYINEPMSQPILSTPINELKASDLTAWATAMIIKHSPVDAKKSNRMFGILNGCIEYAIYAETYGISTNIWHIARKRVNPALFARPRTPLDSEQVFTDDERRQLAILVYEDLEKYKKQTSSAGLQILFMLETALRRGEACGLKWSDIHGNRLAVQRQANNEGVKEWTKTASGRREIPLTQRALEILDDVKKFNEARGYDKDWIFQSGSPCYDYRLSYNAAEHKLKKLCARLDTTVKSTHKLRKTCISALLDDPNVNNRTVQRFAGHADIRTTESFYNFERRNMDEQAAAIDRALRI